MNNVTEFVNKNVDAKLVMMMGVVNAVEGAGYVEVGAVAISTRKDSTYINISQHHYRLINVCEISELNKLITELTEAAWLNKDYPGEPQSYKAYKAAYAKKIKSVVTGMHNLLKGGL